MPFFHKTKKLRLIFVVYWVLLLYIIAALVWWFIALNKLNHQMAAYELNQLKKDSPGYIASAQKILDIEKRKTTQYAGEGAVFFLLIGAGAFFIFRAVLKQFKQAQQQQHLMMAITHELKTPIAVTRLNLETMQKRKLDEKQQQHLIQNTLQETNRMNDLCSNLLLSSQIEAGGYQITIANTDLSLLATQCMNDFITRYPNRHITHSIQPGVQVNADQLLLQLVINNLLDNALKYSLKDAGVHLTLCQQNNLATLSVADAGKGIKDEEKKKIFDKYYRTGNSATRHAKGTGLGLYLTKKIIQQHQASITVTDNHPTGSIFTVTFGS
ncbi:MAG: hypothetical protein RL172_769 [Bacteroidota bacterium]|jgi:two-component system, OmpR family, sensor histidine kinase CiaH